MNHSKRACLALALGLLLGAAAGGCSGSGKSGHNPTEKDKLQEIAQMLRTVESDKTRPPARLADLGAVEPMLPTSAQSLRSGDIVYVWGARLSSGGNASSTVLAYEKKAATEGGWVLMQDGTVKKLSAAEFAGAPKAR
jgi:hypothetical protein